jgi:CRISPR-associated protein Csm1
MQTIRERIYLAALLHDIGKFYQRADTGSTVDSIFLSDQIKKLELTYCPLRDGKYSHKHVLWTAQFIDDFRPVFEALVGTDDLENSLFSLACSHHLKADQLSQWAIFIQQADHLSSGMDRNSDDAFKDEQVIADWDKFRKMRMVSVFEGISKTGTELKYHLPVEELSLSGSFFPSRSFEAFPDYKKLWNGFVTEFKCIQAASFNAFTDTLLNLLWKYTCTIPSSTMNLPDVSLYDHLKTTAAFAVTLYDWSIADKETNKNPFLLIGADISGIQSFIYDIISKGAAKNLKGRSFYIQLLIESVLQKLLKTLDLPQANIVYSSGGGFYVLAPNTQKVIEELKKYRLLIEDAVFKEHGTTLYVAIDSIELSKDTLLNKSTETLGEQWAGLTEKLSVLKKQRYSHRLVTDYATFFEPGETGGTGPKDAITGEEFTALDLQELFDLKGGKVASKQIADGLDVIKKSTWHQIALGKALRDAEYWVTSGSKITYWGDAKAFDPLSLGIWHYFLTAASIKEKQDQLIGSADEVRISLLNCDDTLRCNFLDSSVKGRNNIFGLSFYGGNDFPEKDGEPLTFDELAKGNGSQFARLGILRMDVDNLGEIFKNGFGDKARTFSRYSALSRNLDWFFKGYLNTIWKSTPLYKNNTFIIYSGGDDLFIVGKWDALISFAEEINTGFKKWVCANEFITLSGGIAVVSPKFPIMKGAAEADESEKLAKGYSYSVSPSLKNEKNAFSLFGMPLYWDNEYLIVKSYKDRILELLKNGEMPKSFISKIYSHSMKTTSEKGDLKPLNALWMMAYDFGRMEQRTMSDKAIELLRECKTNVFANSFNGKPINSPYHFLELINLATRWAELEIRSN